MPEVEPADQRGRMATSHGQMSSRTKKYIVSISETKPDRTTVVTIIREQEVIKLPIICHGRQYCLIAGKDRDEMTISGGGHIVRRYRGDSDC